MKENIAFADLGLSSDILSALKKKGFVEATEIQARVIPELLERKHDVIGIAQTGTGKTAAFGLPIINNISTNNKTPKAIILTPTRELALQVSSELNTYVGKKRINITTVYGGASINMQIKALNKGVDIVVGTPGRVMDLINRRKLNLKHIEYFILDEADEMLNMGFISDIETILENANKNRNVLLFSATMPQRIKQLSKKYMRNQKIVEAKKRIQTSNLIEHIYYKVKHSEKFDALSKILADTDFFYGIIFCKTKRDVESVTKNLKKFDYNAACIHGDIAQNKREKILNRFRKQNINILVATDVAARGIDVENLSHVINYALPQELETYVHRIGRTGRAGNKGIAISLITPKEMRVITPIEKLLETKISKGELPIIDVKKASNKRFEKGSEKSKEKFKSKLKPKSVIPKAQKGETRLFIAKGTMDKIDKRSLIYFLEKETNIKSIKAKNIKVCEKFSFATVNSNQAEKIIDVFESQKRRRPLVEVASN